MLVPAAPGEAPPPLVPRASRTPAVEPRPDAAVASLLTLAPKTRSGVGLKPSIAPRPGSVRPPRGPTHPTGAQAHAPPRRPAVEAELVLREGLKHLAAGRFEQALPQIEQAQQLCPELREAAIWLHVGRARQCKAAGRDHEAIEEYRAVLELDAEHREALEHAGEQRRGRGKLIGKWFGASDE
jgi:tetratricopeptide (TPR) repeat protein